MRRGLTPVASPTVGRNLPSPAIILRQSRQGVRDLEFERLSPGGVVEGLIDELPGGLPLVFATRWRVQYMSRHIELDAVAGAGADLRPVRR